LHKKGVAKTGGCKNRGSDCSWLPNGTSSNCPATAPDSPASTTEICFLRPLDKYLPASLGNSLPSPSTCATSAILQFCNFTSFRLPPQPHQSPSSPLPAQQPQPTPPQRQRQTQAPTTNLKFGTAKPSNTPKPASPTAHYASSPPFIPSNLISSPLFNPPDRPAHHPHPSNPQPHLHTRRLIARGPHLPQPASSGLPSPESFQNTAHLATRLPSAIPDYPPASLRHALVRRCPALPMGWCSGLNWGRLLPGLEEMCRSGLLRSSSFMG